MFLCEGCHDRMYQDVETMHHFGESISRGHCEMCSDLENCWDCHCPPASQLPKLDMERVIADTKGDEVERIRQEFIKEMRAD